MFIMVCNMQLSGCNYSVRSAEGKGKQVSIL